VTGLNSRPTIGEPFSLECNITVIKGIIGNVDVLWTANGTAIRRVNNVVGHTIGSQEMLHSDVYEISKLQPSDNNTIYRCEAIIRTNEPLNGSDNITLTISKQAGYFNVPITSCSSNLAVATYLQYIATYI